MSSLRQIEANRRNSLRSTGPRTPEGNPWPVTGAVSRFHTLKSGINAKIQVIPGEDPADLQAMADGYTRDWAPKTYRERFLVDSLVRADWLLQRLSRLEAELWTHQMEAARKLTFSKLDENSPLGDVYRRSCDTFTRLQRRIDSTERSYYRALAQLQRLRQDPGDSDADFDSPGPELALAPSAPDCANEPNSATEPRGELLSPPPDPRPRPDPGPASPALEVSRSLGQGSSGTRAGHGICPTHAPSVETVSPASRGQLGQKPH